MSKSNKEDDKVAESANKKLKEIFCSSDDKEFERMLASSKYRYASFFNANKKNNIVGEHDYNKRTLKKIYIIFWGWFFFSICAGWIFYYFACPPDFFLDFYSGYRGYVNKYDLFCMAMMLAILTFPLVFWLLFREFFKLAKSPSWGVKIIFIAMMSILMHCTTGIGGLGPIGQGGGRGDPRTLVALLFDWQGAVLLNLFIFTCFILAVATALKSKEN